MAVHLVVGAGPVGSTIARLLLERGENVRVATRRGFGPEGSERLTLDAADAPALAAAATGAMAIYNCVNPPYNRWPTDWPPIADALISAAEVSGAVLVTAGNLYPYGEVTRPMVEGLPDSSTGTKGRVRAEMTRGTMGAHRAGRIRAVEVRAGDYLGGDGMLSAIVVPALLKGRTAMVPADLDAPHTWTNVEDVARLMVTVAADEQAWGRIWHVPSARPASVREISQIAADQLGKPLKLRAMPYPMLWLAGVFNAFVRELRETQHQFRAPYVMDSQEAQRTFGLRPAPLADSVALDLTRSAPAVIRARQGV